MNEENTQKQQTENNEVSEQPEESSSDEVSEVQPNPEESTETETEDISNNSETGTATEITEVEETQPDIITEDTVDEGVKDPTEVEKEAAIESDPIASSNNVALDYGQHMEVNVNGTKYAGYPLIVPKNIVETVKHLLFEAHGAVPNNG